MDVKKTISDLNSGIEFVNSTLPLAFAAYQQLKKIWEKEAGGTEMTFEQYNARLLNESAGVVGFSQDWFRAHGYVQQPDGSWIKTPIAPAVHPPAPDAPKGNV